MEDTSWRQSAAIIIALWILVAGVVAGATIKTCQHDRGDCQHVIERAEVEAVLDCLRRAGR
jgi:hypothetical protein